MEDELREKFKKVSTRAICIDLPRLAGQTIVYYRDAPPVNTGLYTKHITIIRLI
jgi:hypothetical protein